MQYRKICHAHFHWYFFNIFELIDKLALSCNKKRRFILITTSVQLTNNSRKYLNNQIIIANNVFWLAVKNRKFTVYNFRPQRTVTKLRYYTQCTIHTIHWIVHVNVYHNVHVHTVYCTQWRIFCTLWRENIIMHKILQHINIVYFTHNVKYTTIYSVLYCNFVTNFYHRKTLIFDWPSAKRCIHLNL